MASSIVLMIVLVLISSRVKSSQKESSCAADDGVVGGCDAGKDDAPVGASDEAEPPCSHFEPGSTLTPDSPSFFLIESKGRLGNHLIAFTVVLALQKETGIRPLVTRETHHYLSRYFENVTAAVPSLEGSFCNWEDVSFDEFEGSLDQLLENKSLWKGKMLNLWPWGYMRHATECCPGEDLQKFVVANYFEEAKAALTFKTKFREHASRLKEEASAKVGIPVDDITFVGIHNRRTDYLGYMEWKFGTTKSPYTKRYFREAMEYFREEHSNPVFFYVSDDMAWGRKNVKDKHGDLFFVGEGDADDADSVGRDLAALGSCRHSVTTWGSFSMWAAFLAGGEYYSEYGVIVPRQIQEPEKKKKKKKH